MCPAPATPTCSASASGEEYYLAAQVLKCAICSDAGGEHQRCGEYWALIPDAGEEAVLDKVHPQHQVLLSTIYRVSGLSCPEAQAYSKVIFHSFLHNNNINSDYILGANIYFTPHSIFSSYF